MSRYCHTSSAAQHHVQSTSMATSATSNSEDPNGGHCASPYLRRFRIPKLNTYRQHLEEDEDDDEWFEMQIAKKDLIRLRMNEMKNSRLKDRTNNNNSTSHNNCKSSSTNHAQQQNSERSDDVESRNGNRCPAAEENSEEIGETEATMRSLWFHPKHLFAPSPTKTKTASAANS
ncbi:unnamed protein product [Caenorhabditis sp. 36 PRJEB53466]|nr:unnamed protein product [Caenorhabditis sp. 36 PRJEB53466]